MQVQAFSWLLAAASLVGAGCGIEMGENENGEKEQVGFVEQGLTCSGTGCNGKDPAAYYCNPGTIVNSMIFYNAYNVRVGVLKRKQGCSAYWAWVDFDTAQPGIVFMSPDKGATRYPTGTGDVWSYNNTPEKWLDQAYSNMWASGSACIEYEDSGHSSRTACVP